MHPDRAGGRTPAEQQDIQRWGMQRAAWLGKAPGRVEYGRPCCNQAAEEQDSGFSSDHQNSRRLSLLHCGIVEGANEVAPTF